MVSDSLISLITPLTCSLMIGRNCKKSKEKDILNLISILQVDNYFMVGTFFPSQENRCVLYEGVCRKKGWEFLFFFFLAPASPAWIMLPVRGLPGNCYFFLHLFISFYFIYLLLFNATKINSEIFRGRKQKMMKFLNNIITELASMKNVIFFYLFKESARRK